MPQVNFPDAFHRALMLLKDQPGGVMQWDLGSKREAYGTKMKIYKFLARAREGAYGAEKQAIARLSTVRQITGLTSQERETVVEWVYNVGKRDMYDDMLDRAVSNLGETKKSQWENWMVTQQMKRGPLKPTATPEMLAMWEELDRAKAKEIGVEYMTGEPLPV